MIELNVALGDYQGEARRVAEFEGDSLRRTNVRQLAPKTIRPNSRLLVDEKMHNSSSRRKQHEGVCSFTLTVFLRQNVINNV